MRKRLTCSVIALAIVTVGFGQVLPPIPIASNEIYYLDPDSNVLRMMTVLGPGGTDEFFGYSWFLPQLWHTSSYRIKNNTTPHFVLYLPRAKSGLTEWYTLYLLDPKCRKIWGRVKHGILGKPGRLPDSAYIVRYLYKEFAPSVYEIIPTTPLSNGKYLFVSRKLVPDLPYLDGFSFDIK